VSENQPNKRPIFKKILRIFLRTVLTLFILFILLVLFIRSPWGQDIIVDKVTNYISDKIDTEFDIGKLYITFSGNVTLEELYLEDENQDTLVYSRYLEANLPFRPLIFENEIRIDHLEWRGLQANVYRNDTVKGHNFQFIIDAFASTEQDQAQSQNDTTATQISIGSLLFSDFDINYKDKVTGINTELRLGQFEAESKAIDLDSMKFDLAQLHLDKTDITYIQSQASKTSNSETSTTLPWILIEELSINQVHLNYQSLTDDYALNAYIDRFKFEGLDAQIDEQKILLENLSWSDSEVKFETASVKETEEENSKEASNSKTSFSWPDWTVNLKNIDLEDNKFEYYQNGKRPQEGKFSSEAIALNSFNFNLKSLKLFPEEALEFQLNNLAFEEASGLELKAFSVASKLDSQSTSLDQIKLKLNHSLLQGDLKLNYTSLKNLINTPEETTANLNIRTFTADLRDAYVFAPDLEANEQIKKLSIYPFEGRLKAEGNLDKLNIQEFWLNWGTNTHVQLDGEVSNMNETENLGFDLKNLVARSNKTELSKFISEEDFGIAFPDQIKLTGRFQKKIGKYSAKSKLITSFGSVFIDGMYSSKDDITYKLKFDIQDLKLNQLFKNEELGNLNMRLASQGEGKSWNALNAQLTSKIDSLAWNNYTFSGMEVQGELNNGSGDINFDYSDENLQFDLASTVQLDSVASKIDLKLNLEGIDTQQLGLTSKDLKAKVIANMSFEGNSKRFDMKTSLEEGLVVYDDRPYYLGDFDFSAKVDSTITEASVVSQFLNAELKANSDMTGVTKALQNHFNLYAEDTLSKTKSKNPVNFELELSFIDTPILSDVFVEGIQQMDSLQASIHFHEANSELTSNFSLPYLNYKDNEVNGLFLDISSTGKQADFNLGFSTITAGPLEIASTELKGVFEDRVLKLALDAFKEEKDFFSSRVSVQFEENDLYRIKVSPEKIILNGSAWSIPSTNEITYQKDTLKVNDFKLSRNDQQILLTDDLEFEKKHIGMEFDNFKLSTITNYLNPDEKLAEGKLSGRFVLLEPFVSNGLVSNLTIKNLRLTEVPLGTLILEAEARSDEDYNLNLSLGDAGIELVAEGLYHTNATETDIDLNFDLKKLEMQTLQKFATDFIKDSKGELRGGFEISGSPEQMEYNGLLVFDQVEFNLKFLNTLFQLHNEKIELDNNSVNFDSFTIRDVKGNKFTTKGEIDIENITNPEFDLSMNAKDFQLLDSKLEDNDLYFGKLIFDAKADITGELDFPKVDLDLTIKEGTDLNYIVPESRASIDERDGVVIFVNKQNPDDILTQQNEEDFEVVLTGVDLESDIKIDKKTRVKVVFNKRSGDNVTLQGGGDFKFDISRTGKMDLVGKYEVSKGSVELNLYNIVKRKFDIASSSTVTWSGDPYNAKLDLRAIYNIETSASALMASQTAGENVAVQNRYRQQLPFEVYLDVGGELTSPKLSFQLDMPESQRGAINGSVYGRLSQINQQEDQLNKQVFSLLVLNRFYPDAGNDGSRGGAASMARDNLNQALSDQLNAFSDKLTGNTGISLNFDVNSYTDYQGSTVQDRTNVDVTAQKKLLDDRLIVQAGSSVNVEGDQRPGESQAVVGNVNVEYLLTEDGRWKLRGFRKSEYENVIDGQVFVSGIALIFTREFNKFKVLWDKAYRESLKEEEMEVETKKKKTEDGKN
jgi:hypothetical protein